MRQYIYCLIICRDDTTRTCDPLVPNQVYYQLYYIPNAFSFEKRCKDSVNRTKYQIYLGISEVKPNFPFSPMPI